MRLLRGLRGGLLSCNLKPVSSPPNPPDPMVPSPDEPRRESLEPDAIFAPGSAPAGAPEFQFARPTRPQPDPPWSIWDVIRIALVALLAIVLFSFVALEIMHASGGKMPNADEVARNPRLVIPAQGATFVIDLPVVQGDLV